MKRTYYYHDLVNDDFAGTKIKTKDIPENYKYVSRNPFYIFFEIILKMIAIPICFLFEKYAFKITYRDKKVIRKCRKEGFFLYGNHTNGLLDAYNPSYIAFPRRVNIITHADAVSIKGIGTLVKMLGAVPIPSSYKAMKNYNKGIEKLISMKHVITIYPEAHIWPYYTDIRPFGTQSFHYPINTNKPSFAFTNIYVKRRFSLSKRPKVVTYVDGPFYPDESLPRQDRIKKLRDDIYNAMKKRVDENPKYNYYEYIYVDDASKIGKKRK